MERTGKAVKEAMDKAKTGVRVTSVCYRPSILNILCFNGKYFKFDKANWQSFFKAPPTHGKEWTVNG